MAEYFARVELFNAGSDEYEKLHKKMQTMGFERTVAFTDDKDYWLPIGTYNGFSNLTPDELRVKVSGIADPLSSPRSASVLVIKSADWSAYLFSE